MALSGSLNFITASQYGSYAGAIGDRRELLRQDESAQEGVFIPTDFVGLNINVKEPISSSQRMLGHAPEVALHGARVGSTIRHEFDTEYNPKYPGTGDATRAPVIRFVDATIFNTLMLHRNGPYGFPTWKQVRVGEHPVARYLRTHNTTSFTTQHSQYPAKYDFSFDNPPSVFIDPENPTGDDFKKWGHNVAMSNVLEGEVYYPINSSYYEPVVVSRHKPVEIYIKGVSLENNPMEAVGRYTVLNNISYFTNWGANKNLNIANIETGSVKNREFRQTLSTFYSDPDTNGMEFTETIFPREVNTYRGLTRDRQNYAESAGTGQFDNVYDKRMHRTFWRDNSENRVRTDATSLNSQNYAQRFGFDATTPPGGEFADNTTFTYTVNDPPMATTALKLNAGFYFNHGSSSYVTNGVVTDQTGSHDPTTATGGDRALIYPTSQEASTSFKVQPTQLEYMQPYPIICNSVWPLEPRKDIYQKPAYLAGIENSGSDAAGLNTSVSIGLSPLAPATTFSSRSFEEAITASISRSAGELVYSTKPTIFYYKQANLRLDENKTITSQYSSSFFHNATGQADGYMSSTASLQFLRHTYPYQTPYWATHIIAGKNPFYDSYDDFASDFRFIGKDYSILPEFRYSDHFNFYDKDIEPNPEDLLFYITSVEEGGETLQLIKRKNSWLQPPRANFLTLDGASITSSAGPASIDTDGNYKLSEQYYELEDLDHSTTAKNFPDDVTKGEGVLDYRSDPQSVEFYAKYSHSETMKNLAFFMNSIDKNTTEDELSDWKDISNGNEAQINNIPRKIELQVKGIKKLLPYNGFYPVLRTVQLGTHLNQAFQPFLTGTARAGAATTNEASGALDAARLQAFLEPLMAPGLLYNSIKSGMAVEYPVYRGGYVVDPNDTSGQLYTSLTSAPSYFYMPIGIDSATKINLKVIHSSSRVPVDVANNRGYDPRRGLAPGNLNDSETWAEGIYIQTSSFNAKLNYQIAGHGLSRDADTLGLGGGYMMGVASAHPTYLRNTASFALPFEALYDVRWLKSAFLQEGITGAPRFSNFLTHDFMDHNRTDNTLFRAPVVGEDTVRGFQTIPNWNPDAAIKVQAYNPKVNVNLRLYTSAMHNFLSEMVDFFIDGTKSSKIPVIHSDAMESVTVEKDQTYALDVSLRQGKDFVLCEGPRTASLQTGYGHKHVKSSERFISGSKSMRGSVFGPPVETLHMDRDIFCSPNTNYSGENIFPLTFEGRSTFTHASGAIDVTDIANGDSLYITVSEQSGSSSLIEPGGPIFATGDRIRLMFTNSLASSVSANTASILIGATEGETAENLINAINGTVSKGKVVFPTGNNEQPDAQSSNSVGTSGIKGITAVTGSTESGGHVTIMANDPLDHREHITIRHTVSGNGAPDPDAPVTSSVLHNLSWTGGGIQIPNQIDSNDGNQYGVYSGSAALLYNLQDPSYQAYTPPYFYGKSHAVVQYTAQQSGEVFISDILKDSKASSYYIEEYEHGLTPRLPTTASVSSGSQNRMKVEASVDIWSNAYEAKENIYKISSVKNNQTVEEEVWWMASKWQCPVLDMAEQDTPFRRVDRYTADNVKITTLTKSGPYGTDEDNNTIEIGSLFSQNTGRSIWCGYGYDPYDTQMLGYLYPNGQGMPGEDLVLNMKDKGIFLNVDNISEDTLIGQGTNLERVANQDGANSRSSSRNSAIGSAGTVSLADTLGFKRQTLKVGKIAESKKITEGVVAIPYFEEAFNVDVYAQPSPRDGNQVYLGSEDYLKFLYGTVEILPGKHFIRIMPEVFERILHILLVDKYISYSNLKFAEVSSELESKYGFTPSRRDAALGTDIGKLIQLVIGQKYNVQDPREGEFNPNAYVLPPEFDFINNAGVTPFQMVIAPFEHTLDKQELIDIYQGVMPDCSMRAANVSSTISINSNSSFLQDDFFFPTSYNLGDNQGSQGLKEMNLANFLNPQAIFLDTSQGGSDSKYGEKVLTGNVPLTTYDYFRRVKWMFFKVKKRAVKNYENYRYRVIETEIANSLGVNRGMISNSRIPTTQGSIDGTSFQFPTIDDHFGVNWPYDYFSLLEKVKVEAKYLF